MKKYRITLLLLLAAAKTLAQGLVNFANTPSTAVYVQPPVWPPQPNTIMSGPAGLYYFELFLGFPINGNINPTGIYATNTGVNGLFSGGTVAVPGWAAGTSQTYWVLGWDAGLGHDFSPDWLSAGLGIGGSITGSGVAGDGNSIPVLNLFDGGGNTITSGFALMSNTLVPEPSTAALATLGAAMVVIFGTSRKLKSRALR